MTVTVYLVSTAIVTIEADTIEEAERIAVYRAPRGRELSDWRIADSQVER